uniref:Bacteriohemerythrin n=1 Tax=Thermocrinis ruber TaxID=75906 RepID=A0A7C5SVM1_9AQUI
MIEFDDNLITHVEEMDKQHMRLVALLNNTYELLKEGKKEEAFEFFKRELLSYIEYHLSEEEKFMEKIGYPELDHHRKVHDMFRRVIYDLAPQIEKGDPKAFREALSYAWSWLCNHIAKTDKKYGTYAKEKGLI